MASNPKNLQTKWVLAYERDGYLVDYLRHPEYMFDNIALASERKGDAYVLLHRLYPNMKMAQIHVAPMRDFQ